MSENYGIFFICILCIVFTIMLRKDINKFVMYTFIAIFGSLMLAQLLHNLQLYNF